MTVKEDFEFLNSDIWINYSQKQYRTPDEIKYRLTQIGESQANWTEMKSKIVRLRKTAAVPFFLKSIDKKFWFYPADCIYQKADEIEKLGLELYQKIVGQSAFSKEFFLDAKIEEAITSAIYEGANSTRAKAKELIESQNAPKDKDEWMLYNNYKAMLWIQENQKKSVSLDVIRELHGIVTKNTLSDDDLNYSGKFRNDKVFVISSARERKHEGKDSKLIESSLAEAFDVTIKNTRYFPKLLKGIILHYFTSYIHPFFDGNGRTARAMFYFKAIKNDLKFVELLSISAYLKAHGKQYEKSFEKVVENDLDLTFFIDFNLDALLEALRKVSQKVEYLLKINELKEKIGINGNQVGLLQRLALNNFRKYDIEKYAESIDRSREVARQELKQLVDLGLLAEIKESKKFVYKIKIDNLEKIVSE
ncbi:MAG: hypothetical protein B7Y39_02025 [Bdellovibrio sp. 28-41-41]|nr:MAG: hypothetical protein B7Y39_02025 [Bdellovibrio sp. 28-41-41]